MPTATVQRRPGDQTFIRSRLALHEAAHAAANFMLGQQIYSVHIGENEGVVKHAAGKKPEDSFDRCVALLAAGSYDRALGQRPSGDTYDEDEVMRVLRRHVAADAVPKAREVVGQAADKLACTAFFDNLVHALSPVLMKEDFVEGPRVDDIFHAAIERDRALHAKPIERHSVRPGAGRRSEHVWS